MIELVLRGEEFNTGIVGVEDAPTKRFQGLFVG